MTIHLTLIASSLALGLIGGFFWQARSRPDNHVLMLRAMQDGRYGSALTGLLVTALPIAVATYILLLIITLLAP